jgi:hypothetical protein
VTYVDSPLTQTVHVYAMNKHYEATGPARQTQAHTRHPDQAPLPTLCATILSTQMKSRPIPSRYYYYYDDELQTLSTAPPFPR